MPLDPRILHARRRFDGGARFTGRDGLELMSVSARMSSPNAEAHRTRVATAAFGDMLVTRIRSQHLESERGGALLDDAYSEYAQLGLITHGTFHIQQGSHERAVNAGELSLLVDSLPFRTRIEDQAEAIQLYLPLSLMKSYGITPAEWAGRSWGSTPSARVLRQLLVSITASPDAIPAGTREHVGNAVRELALAALHEAAAGMPARYEAGIAHRIRARALIGERFTDPTFDLSALAASLNVSLRYLHSLFADEETTPGELLRGTRLRHGAALLRGPQAVRRTIATVATASGYRGEDQFIRAFRRMYGTTPAEYRAQNPG